MKRKLSLSTSADAQQRLPNYETSNKLEFTMSQHQLVVDCKDLSINPFSTGDESCNTSLVRQNACDSGSSPTEEILKPVASPSISSIDSVRCSVDRGTDCINIVNSSDLTSEGSNCVSSNSAGYLDPQSFFSSSTSSLLSNNSNLKSTDRVRHCGLYLTYRSTFNVLFNGHYFTIHFKRQKIVQSVG